MSVCNRYHQFEDGMLKCERHLLSRAVGFSYQIRHCSFLAVSLLSSVILLCGTGDNAVQGSEDGIKVPHDLWGGVSSFTSASGNFVVVGRDKAANVELARWSEDVVKKLEAVLGVKLPLDSRHMIRIVNSTNETGVGKVVINPPVEGTYFLQDFQVYNYSRVNQSDADEALCNLLVGVQLNGRGDVPYWFSRGLAQNLYQPQKARNNEKIISMWREGMLTTVSEFLSRQAYSSDPRPNSALCGVFTGWLVSMFGDGNLRESIYGRFTSGGRVTPQWLVSVVPGCGSIPDLEEMWDKWVLKQEHVVHQPGMLMRQVAEQIQAELVVYPGQFGVPVSGDPEQVGGLSDLIKVKGESWVPGFCRAKICSLGIIAAGRGDKVAGAVNAYNRFFEALIAGKNEAELGEILQDADYLLAKLSDKTEETGGGGGKKK